MKLNKRIFSAVTLCLSLILIFCIYAPFSTGTGNIIGGSEAYGATESTVFKGCGGRDLTQVDNAGRDDLVCVVGSAVDLLLKVGGSIIMLMIMISGIFYIMSMGDPNQTAMAKKTLVGSIIGLIIVILSYTMVMIVIGFFQ